MDLQFRRNEVIINTPSFSAPNYTIRGQVLITISMQEVKQEYPFHTEQVEDELLCGVAFQAGTGRFYEFVDPDEHDEWLKLRDPRDGKELTFDGRIDLTWRGNCVSGLIMSKFDAQKWAEYREIYVNSSESDNERWRDMWDDIHSMNPDE